MEENNKKFVLDILLLYGVFFETGFFFVLRPCGRDNHRSIPVYTAD